VLTQLVLNNLSVQFGRAGAGVVTQGGAKPGGVSFFLPTKSPQGVSGNGHRLDESSLVINQPGDEFYMINNSMRPWFSVYIPYETLVGSGGDATTPIPSLHGFVQVPLPRMQRFRSFIGSSVRPPPGASRLRIVRSEKRCRAEAGSRDPQPARRAVRSRIHARPARGAACANHSQVYGFCGPACGEYLSVEQLAPRPVFPSETLRETFQQYFGVPPVRYLNRRTLHQVRSALKAADPSVATVTEIATRFGVWELGRFARDYRVLFGELPSETLRH